MAERLFSEGQRYFVTTLEEETFFFQDARLGVHDAGDVEMLLPGGSACAGALAPASV